METLRKIAIIFLVVFLFYSLTKNLLDYTKKLDFYQSYKNDYEKETKRNIELQTQILKKSDPYELEKTLRNKLNLLKPDEIAIILPKPSPTPIVITPTPAPNWQQWWNVFF